MKFLGSVLTTLQQDASDRQHLRIVFVYIGFLVALVLLYSVAFHYLMALEGRDHSWLTGVYWTLVVMSTLGFGDITFTSDLGRAFSIVVLLTGMVSLLILLPFVFIEFFYVPFLKAQARARAPRRISERISGHVILTNDDPVARSLITMLRDRGYPYVLLASSPEAAMEMAGRGMQALVGATDDPETYRNAGIARAALLVATGTDIANTNAAFTVRDLNPAIRIVTTARETESEDILALAGSSMVLKPGEMLGNALARRIIAGDARAHVIGEIGDLTIAEATVAGTPMVGKTLAECRLEKLVGIRVVGTWQRGTFTIADPETRISDATVLVLAGSAQQVARYNAIFCIYHVAQGEVLILGAGRVGRATANALALRGVECCLVDRHAHRLIGAQRFVTGNATDRSILDRAGINTTPAVVVTTHDDDVNTFLTIYVRRLRPAIEVISRATQAHNVATMHRAGADFVMSYASLGATTIFNYLQRSDVLILAEGLNVSRVPLPTALVGKTLASEQPLRDTGCHLVAIGTGNTMDLAPDPQRPLTADMSLVVVGSLDDERRLLARYARR